MKIAFFLILLSLTLSGYANAKESWEKRASAAFNKPVTKEEKNKIADAIPKKPTSTPRQDRKILVFSRCEGFIHKSIPYGKEALAIMASKTGAFSVEFNDDYEVFSEKNLKSYDAILFNNTTGLTPDKEQQEAIMHFIKSGKGIIGIHGATDNFQKWHEGLCMMGGVFAGHPWNAKGTYPFKLDDAEHPVNDVFNGKGFWFNDEIYQYKPDSYQGAEQLRILVSMDMSHEEGFKPLLNHKKKKDPSFTQEQAQQAHIPVSWLRPVGKGRLFYTNFGHHSKTYWNPNINRHLLDGIQYALGDLDADDTPTAEMKDLVQAHAPEL